MHKILAGLRSEPAASFVTILGGIVAVIVAVWHLPAVDAGILSSAATAIGTIITAFLARPVNVAVIPGAVATILEALTIFGVHMSPAEIAAVVAVINLLLGYVVMRPQLTPLVHLRPEKEPESAAM